MKKIFFFALASLALASCSQDEEFAPENGSKANAGNGNISFNTYIAGATRADRVTSEDVVTSGFMVNATFNSKMYITNEEAQNGIGTKDGVDGKDGVFDTKGNTYYWPISTISGTNPMMFYAFNKIEGAAFADASAPATANQVNYTVKATAKTQEDLVIASAKAIAQPTNGEQPLNFTHALSMINFSIKAGNTNAKYTYAIKKIEVLANSGLATCTIAETTESAADTEQPTTNTQSDKASWTAPESVVPTTGSLWEDLSLSEAQVTAKTAAAAAKGTLYEYYNGEDKTVTTDGTLKFDEDMMLYPNPESGSNKIAIRVYYKITDSASGEVFDCGYDNIGCKTVVIDNAAWEAGKAYRYTLTLPLTHYTGDTDADGVADDQDLEASNTNVDGDGDNNASEFATALPIRFTVFVSDWIADSNPETNKDITIK